MAWNAWKRCCKKVDSQGDGTLPQVIHGGTRLTGVGGAHNIILSVFLLQLVSFTVDSDPL